MTRKRFIKLCMGRYGLTRNDAAAAAGRYLKRYGSYEKAYASPGFGLFVVGYKLRKELKKAVKPIVKAAERLSKTLGVAFSQAAGRLGEIAMSIENLS